MGAQSRSVDLGLGRVMQDKLRLLSRPVTPLFKGHTTKAMPLDDDDATTTLFERTWDHNKWHWHHLSFVFCTCFPRPRKSDFHVPLAALDGQDQPTGGRLLHFPIARKGPQRRKEGREEMERDWSLVSEAWPLLLSELVMATLLPCCCCHSPPYSYWGGSLVVRTRHWPPFRKSKGHSFSLLTKSKSNSGMLDHSHPWGL